VNRHRLKEEIISDEGMVFHIYKDHLGYPTVGCGHLITEKDEEFGKPEGTQITEDRASELFETDIENAIDDCRKLYTGFEVLPQEVQHIIVNMMFNLGLPRLSKFKKMKAAVEVADYRMAASEMVASKWFTQVPNRAARLVERMRKADTSAKDGI